MSEYAATRIRKQPHANGLKSLNGKQQKERYIIGFDSEADTSSQGQPMLFQFSLPGSDETQTICVEIGIEKHAGLRAMLEFLDRYCTDKRRAYHIWVWNIDYELTQIFHDLDRNVRNKEKINIAFDPNGQFKGHSGWKIELLNVKKKILKFRKGDILVQFYDGYGYYKTTLDKAAKMLGLGEKYVMQEGMSRALFTREHLKDEEFLLYAKRDAYITRRIGEYIAQQHLVYNINQTISAPHFAATVFKTEFLGHDLTPPTERIEQAGLYSYHGGKNGFYLDGPFDFPDIWSYDITSAYPEAMRQLPNLDGSYWRPTRDHIPGQHAIVKVTGQYHRCKWRGMQNHNGTWTPSGYVENVWITSYELDAMVSLGEFEPIEITGYEMLGGKGGPLTSYVDRFFAVKRTTTGPERETAKLLLNSLYGKFFQKQPIGSVGHYNLDTREWIISDPSQDWDYEAGGLYHPPIASLITGFVRARIHRLEHKYDAVMTSTDGWFGFNPPDPTDLGDNLGQLKAERGRLRIWRERLYIFDGHDGQRKFALHGFRNNVAELEKIPLARGEYTYEGRQMITLKQANTSHNKQTYEPGTFVVLPYRIKI